MSITPHSYLFEDLIRPFCPDVAQIPIFVTSNVDEVEEWVQIEILNKNVALLGIDAEWKPLDGQVKGTLPTVAVIQISTLESALVFQILHCSQNYSDFKEPTHLPLLHRVMNDVSIVKVSIEILHDTCLISSQYNLNICGRVDIAGVDSTDELCFQAGLVKLCVKYFGKEMPKPKIVQKSNWESQVLTDEQVMYAALDAWICIPLFLEVKKHRPYEVDETTPFEGKRRWDEFKRKVKKRRKLEKKKKKLSKKVILEVSNDCLGHSIWEEFCQQYIIPHGFMNPLLQREEFRNTVVEMYTPTQILVHSKASTAANSLEKILEILEVMISMQKERGTLPFTRTDRDRRGWRKIYLDMDGINVNSKERDKNNDSKALLLTKLDVFGLWLEARNRREKQLEQEPRSGRTYI